ncbi:MAG: UDP-N-acetylmuramoyl-L-alanine--D-glutamate ligase [Beijerinckiaceae bacterium]|nr:UDP-N-acetylmuramoyl-L-alanine--D-glutamate ligase [Beijerinckiaceae bacterium]
MTISRSTRSAAIWGLGREGLAALGWMRERYPSCVVTILNDTPLSDALQDVPVLIGEDAAQALRDGRFEVVIKSPGVSLYRPEIAAARAKGVRFTSGVNLWFRDNPAASTVAVTGTKGKSTTARLLHHMLTKAGLDAALIGNVGVAPLGQKPGRDLTVLELSSYQIADLYAAPNIALVTNLYVDHTPWHGGVEQYHRDKLRLIANPMTIAVLNANSDRLVEKVGERTNSLWYGRADAYHVRDGKLMRGEQMIDTSTFPLRGEHNLENLAAACTVCDLVGVTGVRQGVDLSGFAQLRHRLEEFRGRDGRLCVNDSISTVPEATLVALSAYADMKVALFIGGTDRGQNHASLLDHLSRAKNIACVVLLPDTGQRIAQEMSAHSLPFPIHRASSLDEGIELAFATTSQDIVFLLSPAAPSFGHFRDFEDRGDQFISLCRANACALS